MIDQGLFARYLDLTPLRGRRAGKVRCVFHQERTASLSVDLDAGVFHCFGCGTQGGLKRFAELVGESPPRVDIRTQPEETAWQVSIRLATSRPVLADLYDLQDWIRRTRHWIAATRAQATDDELGWAMLTAAAHLECRVLATEAELDSVYAQGPIA